MIPHYSNRFKLALLLSLMAICGCSTKPRSDVNELPGWALGGFTRPEGANPVISPDTDIKFSCPMTSAQVGWMESDTFNPASVEIDGKIAVIFRAEDNSAQGIGSRTSRLGLALSEDGVKMDISPEPVMFPDEDSAKEYEWPGGCEDPRVAVTQDGTYVMMYTSWNRKVPRLCVATSRDLRNWTKHGPAFGNAYEGRFKDMACKSGSIVTEVRDGRQVIAKIGGKYMMYWGESMVNIAESDDLVNWIPRLGPEGELLGVMYPREGFFDSSLTECGPPALVTKDGILLLYNGKNSLDDTRDPRYPAGTYSAGQVLFDSSNPEAILERLDVPFFRPMDDFEKSGQYAAGTVFIEGLTLHDGKWYLYYGCADSRVGVAVFDPTNPVPGDPVPQD